MCTHTKTKGIHMLDKQKSLEMIDGFQNHYNYDTSYMKDMLNTAPEAYETFEAFLPMANFVKKTPLDVLYVAKVTAMKNEDCAACVQLIVDMALEAGVSQDLVKEIIFNEGRNLPTALKDVYDFTLSVAKNTVMPDGLYAKMLNTYGREIMIELALVIAGAKVFPAIKRTLNNAQSCSLIEIKI